MQLIMKRLQIIEVENHITSTLTKDEDQGLNNSNPAIVFGLVPLVLDV
jgi:hypothetical protein